MSPVGGVPTAPRRNHLFDGMRGLAAIMVVAMHFTVVWQHRAGSDWQPFPQAALAVDFFFLLSGFVIARAYEPRLAKGMRFGQFFEVRALRLYPLYLLGLLLGVAKQGMGWLMHDPAVSSPLWVGGTALFNLLMLPPPFFHQPADFLFQLNPPAWSLLMEGLVNLLFAAWLVRLSTRSLAIVAAIGAGVLVIGIARFGQADIGTSFLTAHFGFARALWGFTLGMILHRLSGHAAPIRTAWALALPLFLLLILGSHVPDRWRIAFDPAAIFFVFPVMIVIGSRLELPRWSVPGASFLGDTSYALYSFHNPLVLAGALVAARLGLGMSVSAGMFVIGTLIAAALAVRVYDEPVRARLAAYLKVRRSAPPQEL